MRFIGAESGEHRNEPLRGDQTAKPMFISFIAHSTFLYLLAYLSISALRLHHRALCPRSGKFGAYRVGLAVEFLDEEVHFSGPRGTRRSSGHGLGYVAAQADRLPVHSDLVRKDSRLRQHRLSSVFAVARTSRSLLEARAVFGHCLGRVFLYHAGQTGDHLQARKHVVPGFSPSRKRIASYSVSARSEECRDAGHQRAAVYLTPVRAQHLGRRPEPITVMSFWRGRTFPAAALRASI